MKRILALMAVALLTGCSASERAASVAWQPWGEGAFEQARREKRLVLLDLGAVWCHWCHVMDRETYGDPEVASLIADHFVAIHINQDERPDLAARYEDFGWPATILFAADGTELGKFRGFMPARRMRALLEAFVADPTPGPSALGGVPVAAAGPATLPADLAEALHERWESAYDEKEHGWGTVHKYLDPDSVELAMAEGRDDRARGTLDAMLRLIDPVWGGVYQYSDGGVWTNPHFEKIMSYQAEDLRIYALAWRMYGDAKYLRAARDIERYLMAFLRSPEGLFYASQDADLVPGEHAGAYFELGDAERRAKGIPRVDQHVYTRENGWAITGLASLYRATGEKPTLEAAVGAATWMMRHRRTPGLGFRHDDGEDATPYLADSLAMARAFFELHQATQEGAWLTAALETVKFIEATFRAEGGYAAAAVQPADLGKPWAPQPQADENIQLVRLAVRLHHEAGDPVAGVNSLAERVASHAMKYLSGLAPGASGVRAAGILLAGRELDSLRRAASPARRK